MCRMALAIGDFRTASLGAGVKAMALGRRAPADAKIKCHPNGWGLVHRAFGGAEQTVRRSLRPLGESDVDRLARLEPGITMIHARHATRPEMTGMAYVHPLQRGALFFCHNGFAPNAVARLGRPPSSFDSEALLDFLVPPGEGVPDRGKLMSRLRDLGPGANSANAFLVSPDRAFVINWFEAEPDFYTMWLTRDRRGLVCASEILPEIAPPGRWQPIGHGKVLEFPVQGG